MIISLDCETTGVDFAHDAMPFLVTTCIVNSESIDGEIEAVIRFWEWPVDPLTRMPHIPDEEVAAIAELLDAADLVYMQNSKFDARALKKIGVALPWEKVRDTLVAGHLLASNHPHDLTSMCIEYLGVDIEKHEIHIKEVVRACRALAKRNNPEWILAEEGEDGMPSVKSSSKRDEDKPWKNDMWLPRAMLLNYDDLNTEWEDACSRYANADSEHTLPLGLEMERIVRERGLWAHYQFNLNLMRAGFEMEECGVTAIGEYTESTIDQFEQYVAEANEGLREIAFGYGHDLELAAGAALNDNMRDFFYGSVHQRCPRCDYFKRVKHWNNERPQDNAACPKCGKGSARKIAVVSPMRTTRRPNLALPVIVKAGTGNACLDKNAMQDYLGTTEGAAHDFIKLLSDKRKRETDLSYMSAYRRFWVPCLDRNGEPVPDYYRIHPNLNPFGTDHRRWASNSPNLQNVGGQEDECRECDGDGCAVCGGTGKSRMSVRACFGPMPNREWWRMDFRSIERRLPVYECGEPKMVEVFEKPNQGPYWGSLYYLTASVLYRDEFWPLADVPIDDPKGFKHKQKRLYKQAKFFDLAKQYACGPRKGDLLSKIKNSFSLVDNEFPLMAALQRKYVRDAEKYGYVETMPSHAIDPTRGYPILASRTDDGRVLTTTPFNYHVSGTACECKNVALWRCLLQCEEWRREGFDAHLPLEVHDELLFDFPRGKNMEENLPRALILKGLMEQSGEDLIPRIPTPVSVEYHTNSWADGVSVS